MADRFRRRAWVDEDYEWSPSRPTMDVICDDEEHGLVFTGILMRTVTALPRHHTRACRVRVPLLPTDQTAPTPKVTPLDPARTPWWGLLG